MIEEAQRCLDLYCQPRNLRRGHHVRYDSRRDAEEANKLFERVGAEVRQEDWQTWRAPSPWHAAVHLLQIAEVFSEISFPGSPLFRGQKDPTWRMVPSLLRQSNQALYRKALKIFSSAMRSLALEGFGNDLALMAAAQHYGLPTPLMDFTVDPLIAVYFASLHAIEGKEVIVWWLPFNHALTLNLLIELPPPWVRRLRHQRGLFVEIPETKVVPLEDHSFRILFPADNGYLKWLRSARREDVLPEDKWFEDALRWCIKYASSDCERIPSDEALGTALRTELGLPPFFLDGMMIDPLRKCVDFFVEMCDWLALKRFKRDGDDHYAYSCVHLLKIREHNAEWFTALVDVYRIFERSGYDKEIDSPLFQLAKAIEVCLAENKARGGDWFVPLHIEDT